MSGLTGAHHGITDRLTGVSQRACAKIRRNRDSIKPPGARLAGHGWWGEYRPASSLLLGRVVSEGGRILTRGSTLVWLDPKREVPSKLAEWNTPIGSTLYGRLLHRNSSAAHALHFVV